MLFRLFFGVNSMPMDKGWARLVVLVIFLTLSILPSCASTQNQESRAAVEKARAEAAPQPKEGDVRTVEGVEYIYGKNVRWMSMPGEPEYVWVRKDQYVPRLLDSFNKALSERDEDRSKTEELKRRLDQLEAEIKRTEGIPAAGQEKQ